MSLPQEIIDAIAISNAKSIGEQPAILANMALANQILNNNLQQQIEISQQQALNQVTLATTAKALSIIINSSGNPADIQKHIAELEKGLEAEQKAFNELIQSNKEISDKIAEVQKDIKLAESQIAKRETLTHDEVKKILTDRLSK